jgi:hypothetical protein
MPQHSTGDPILPDSQLRWWFDRMRVLARIITSLADFDETSLALIAPARPAATLGPATPLFVSDHRQHRPQG